MSGYSLIGSCPHCGSPIYSPTVWHSVLPPAPIKTCPCVPGVTWTSGHTTARLDRVPKPVCPPPCPQKREDYEKVMRILQSKMEQAQEKEEEGEEETLSTQIGELVKKVDQLQNTQRQLGKAFIRVCERLFKNGSLKVPEDDLEVEEELVDMVAEPRAGVDVRKVCIDPLDKRVLLKG